MCLAFSRCLGLLAYFFDRRGQQIAFENVRCALGDDIPSLACLAMVRQSYFSVARTMFDLFWSQRLNADNYREWIHLVGFEAIQEESRRRNCGVIFVCIHQGNWELGNLGAGFFGFPNVTVVENFKNARLAKVFAELRERSGAKIVSQEHAILRMNRALRAGASVGILGDLTMRPGRLSAIIEAFETRPYEARRDEALKICAPVIHALLAKRTGALLVPVDSQSHADGTVTVTAHQPVGFDDETPIGEIAQRCWDKLEVCLRARPEEYLWRYKHFRYRPKTATRRYPFYANTSSRFEKMLSPALGHPVEH